MALVAPGCEVAGTCDRQSRALRTEVTVSSQAMASFKFAIADRIMAFGWDESTKFGDDVFSCKCNAQVQYAKKTPFPWLPTWAHLDVYHSPCVVCVAWDR